MSSTGETWRLGHRPALDGLRGVAVTLVVADHAGWLYPSAGSIGVMMFFVLSGFLITRLIVEARGEDRWSLGRFYWRRFVRLVPALYVMLGTVTLVRIWVGVSPGFAVIDALPAALYMQNYAPDGWGSMFAHAWSLGVEEQFYLLWPLALPVVLRRRRPLVWLAATAASSMLLSTTAPDGAGLHMQAYGLLAGCGLALVVTELPRRVPGWVASVGWTGLVAALAYGSTLGEDDLAHRMSAVPFAVLLVWCGTGRVAVLESAGLVFLGRISYALYLWHLPALALVGQNHGGLGAAPVVVVSVLVAAVSTVWLEEPLRRRLRTVPCPAVPRSSRSLPARS